MPKLALPVRRERGAVRIPSLSSELGILAPLRTQNDPTGSREQWVVGFDREEPNVWEDSEMIAARSIWRVALVLGICLMGASSPRAQTVYPEAYRSRVLALQKDGDRGERVVALRDGDVLPSGALFRVEITPLKRLALKVFLESAQGEKTELYRSSDLALGEVVSLPGKTQWYASDSDLGLDTINIVGQEIPTTQGISHPQVLTRHMITHMSADYPVDFADPEYPGTVRARSGGSESAKLRVSELVGGRIPPDPGLIESYVAGVRRYGRRQPWLHPWNQVERE